MEKTKKIPFEDDFINNQQYKHDIVLCYTMNNGGLNIKNSKRNHSIALINAKAKQIFAQKV